MRPPLLLLLAAGCAQDTVACPTPLWSVETTGETHVRAMPDGTLVVLLGEVGTSQLGDQMVPTPALARISPTGAISSVVSLGMTSGHALEISEDGAPLIRSDFSLRRYDKDFNLSWTSANADPLAFDVASTGQAVYVELGTFHYLDATGAEVWNQVLSVSDKLRMSPAGALIAFDLGSGGAASHRLRFDPTGAMLDDTPFPPVGGLAFDSLYIPRDGSLVFIDDPYASIPSAADASGALRWRVPLRTTLNSPIIASNGDVLAVTDLGTAIVRFDGATGAIRGQVDNCHADGGRDNLGDRPLVFADASSYVLLQAVGDPAIDTSEAHYAIAAYAGP